MKTKIFTLMFLSVFVVAMLAAFASAATVFSDDFNDGDLSGWTATGWTNSGTFAESVNETGASLSRTISTSGFEDVVVSYDRKLEGDWESDNSFVVSWSTDGSTFNVLENVTGNSADTSPSDTSFSSKTFSLPSSANDNSNFMLKIECSTDSVSSESCNLDDVKVEGNSLSSSFCKNGVINDDDLTLNVDISNRGEGDDDEWIPLDTIEIEVELENDKDEDGDGDLNDVVFEISLVKDGETKELIDDMIWISEDEEEKQVGDIDEDEKDSHTFEFRVDPQEVEDDNYELRVKAYEDGDEEVTCIDYSNDLEDFGTSDSFADLKVSKENDEEKMVVVDEDSYPSVINAFCGETVNLLVDVYNIGDENFDDQIKVTLSNNALGVNLETIELGDFDEGDRTEATFSFKVPENAKEGTYDLLMATFYDYDKDDDVYDEVSEDTFKAVLNVEGNCNGAGVVGGTGQTSVSASLESGGKAGETLTVRSTITNSGTSTKTYGVNAAGYGSWASSANINPTSLTLGAGESRDVLITFNVNEDASGDASFTVEVLSGNQLAAIQPVSVAIEPTQSGTGFDLSGSLGSNWYLWVFGIINVVLVVVIIVVAVRVLGK